MAPWPARLLLLSITVETALQWSSLGAAEAARWPVSFALWSMCLLFVFRRPMVWAGLLRAPTVFLVAFGVWSLVASRWSPIQPSSFALGVGLLTVVLFGAAYVDRFGWQDFSAVVTIALASFLALGWTYTVVSSDIDSTTDSSRLVGLSANPTAMGLIAALMALMSLSGLRGRPVAISGIVAFAGIVIFLANARTASIALVLGLLLVVVGSTRGVVRTAALGGMMIGAGALLIVILAGDTVSPSLARSQSQNELETLTGRTGLWDLADGWYAERPIAGHGLQGANELYAGAEERGELDWEARDAHNTIIHTLLEVGLIGALLLVTFTGTFLVAEYGLPDPRVSAPVLAILLVGITESLMHEATLALLILAGAGAASVARRAKLIANTPVLASVE